MCLNDGAHVRRFEDYNCYRIKLERQVVLTVEVRQDSHSRKGIMDIRPLSLALPVYFGKMIAFSGLGGNMLRVGVEQYYFRQIAVKILEVFNWLSVL